MWGYLFLIAVLVLPEAAAGQFLPRPFTTPVADLLRREAAAVYADHRRVEVAQKTMERIYEEMGGLGIPEYHWREETGVIAEVADLLDAGASLGYTAEDLVDQIERLFRVRPGYHPIWDQGARQEAVLDAYRVLATSGRPMADDFQSASATLTAIYRQIEGIGQGFAGLTELGSHQESAQSEAQAAILAAEEMVRMRQNIALQINADIIAYLERIAQDRENHVLTTCLVTGRGCPDRFDWPDEEIFP
jgi:hypothetical protein